MQANKYIANLAPYQPGLPIELVARQYNLQPHNIIKLASNENPLGMSPKAKLAVQRAAQNVHRYPEQHDLLQAISATTGVAPDGIVLGNGSNDVLDLIARTYIAPGDSATSSQYAFAIYQIATQSAGGHNSIAPAKDFGHDLTAMRRAITPTTKIIWIANPNNPTGTYITPNKLAHFIASVPPHITVVLDEAYYEYLAPSDRANTTDWLAHYKNLIIVRTFSKIYGLAGLRIGYGLASPQIANLLNRVRQPFNANNLALCAATAALNDTVFVKKSYSLNLAERTKLTAGLHKLGLRTLPAFGNFVTARVANANHVNQQLLQRGIIVRPLAGYDMPDYLRITVGLATENAALLQALADITS